VCDDSGGLTEYRVRAQGYGTGTYVLGHVTDAAKDFDLSVVGVYPDPGAALLGLVEHLGDDCP
jgi:hypothetical protein